MGRAQDRYAAMLRDRIGPALRELGLTGSGGSYRLPSDDHWALVGFQRSVHNSADEVRFTVNLTVVSRAAWEAARLERSYLPARPSPNTRFPPFAWQCRLGTLLPGGNDTWWSVGPGSADERTASEVLSAIEGWALPAMRAQLGMTEPTD